MKKNSIVLSSILVLSFILTSCQKVIQLDLSSSVPQIVIQGNIYDEAGPYKVKISKTVDFDALNIFPPVTNASVMISDDTGISEKLTQLTDGTYVTSSIQGVPGHTYNLTVKIDGKTYTASSTMPVAVNIDSVYFKNILYQRFKYVTLNFRNQPNKKNYYRIISFINDKQTAEFNVFSEYTNKLDTISNFFMSTNVTPKLVVGDNITVLLECIDKGVFEYFRTENSEGGRSASPANPVSNISNGALGYFNACSVRKGSIIFK